MRIARQAHEILKLKLVWAAGAAVSLEPSTSAAGASHELSSSSTTQPSTASRPGKSSASR